MCTQLSSGVTRQIFIIFEMHTFQHEDKIAYYEDRINRLCIGEHKRVRVHSDLWTDFFLEYFNIFRLHYNEINIRFYHAQKHAANIL